MAPIVLSQLHRDQLKEMMLYLYPEYRNISVGGDYVSMSKSKVIQVDMNWNRVHWLELLMRGALPRIASVGRHNKSWLAEVTWKLTLALIAPEAVHPIELIYEEYRKLISPKEEESKMTA